MGARNQLSIMCAIHKSIVFLLFMQCFLGKLAYSSETVMVTLKKEGKTVTGTPVIEPESCLIRLLRSSDEHEIKLNQIDLDEWQCQLAKNESYVIGWKSTGGWFRKIILAYNSEPFTASKDGLKVSFSPGLPATFEYDLSNLPKHVREFPVRVTLYKKSNNDIISIPQLTKVVRRPGVARISNLAGGKYYLEVSNAPMKHQHRPYIQDKRMITIEADKLNRFQPVLPVLDTKIEPEDVTIQGKVFDAFGNPLSGKNVTLQVFGKNRLPQRELYYDNIKTNSVGFFSFKGVVPYRDVYIFCENEAVFLTRDNFREKDIISVNVIIGNKVIQCVPGEPFATLTLAGLDGDIISVESHKGNIVVYDFWATWCGPCYKALDRLNSLAKEPIFKEVLFVAICIDNSPDQWRKKLAKQKWNALSHGWFNPQKNNLKYDMSAIPFYVVVNQNGIVKSAGSALNIQAEISDLAANR